MFVHIWQSTGGECSYKEVCKKLNLAFWSSRQYISIIGDAFVGMCIIMYYICIIYIYHHLSIERRNMMEKTRMLWALIWDKTNLRGTEDHVITCHLIKSCLPLWKNGPPTETSRSDFVVYKAHLFFTCFFNLSSVSDHYYLSLSQEYFSS